MRQEARVTLIALALSLAGCQSASLPEPCYQKPDSGMCRAAFERFYFDADSAQCRPFIWGGCDGSVPFETLEDCQQSCMNNVDGGDADTPELKRRSY